MHSDEFGIVHDLGSDDESDIKSHKTYRSDMMMFESVSMLYSKSIFPTAIGVIQTEEDFD